MLKYLAVAVAIALIGVGATVLLLLAADPSYLNWWHCKPSLLPVGVPACMLRVCLQGNVRCHSV